MAQALAHIAKDRDQHAWASLVETLGSDITRLATRLIGDRTLVQDAVHETLLLVRDHAHRFIAPDAGADAAARSWVLRVAANASLQLVRRTRRELGRDHRAGLSAAQTAPAVAAPGEQMERDDEAAVLRRELSALPPAYAEALALHYLAGQDYPALASQLTLPVNTVRTRIHRGLKALRGRLKRCGLALSLAALTGLLTDLGAQTVVTALLPASAAGVITSSAAPTTAFMATSGTFLATAGGMLVTSALSLMFVIALAVVAMPLLRSPAPAPPPATALAGTAAVSADPPMRSAEQDIWFRKMMERGIALGFPDTKGATIFRGPLEVSSQAANGAITMDSFDGVHAQLADGRWLVNLCYPLKPAGTITVSTAKMKPLPEDSWIEEGMPMSVTTKGPDFLQGSMGIRFAALFRASAKQDGHEYNDALICSRNDLDPDTWAEPGPLGGMPSYLYLEKERKYAYGDGSGETALRYALSRWFVLNCEDIRPPFSALPRKVAIASAKAMLPDEDSGMRTEIDRLAALDQVPATSAAGAPMAERLITWRTRRARNDASYRTTWRGSDEGETDANRFSGSDLPALMALLGDPRPSLWMDAYHPRTIGDQALRAISTVLRFDPRWLITRDVNATWNDQERRVVAAGLAAWWKANQRATPEQIRSAVVSRMDPPAIVALIAAAPAEERPQFYGRLPQMWQDRAPAGYDDSTYELLTGGDNFPEVVAMAKRWPPTGEPRAMLAYWRFQHGDSEPLTAVLEDALTQTAWPQTRAPTYREALILLSVKPDVAMVRRFQQVLAGDLASNPTKAMVGGCLGEDGIPFQEESGWRALAGGADQYRKVLHLTFLAQLMHDPRPLSADMPMVYWSDLHFNKRIADKSAMRVCCFWACVFPSKNAPPPQLYPPLELRDQYITSMDAYLAEVLPELRAEVHLDVTIPGFDQAGRAKGADGF